MNKKYKEILKKCTVLLVDDELKLRSKFKSILLTYVDKVYEASNGEDALEIFNIKKPNIVITDIKMPLMDGLMLTTLLRKIDEKLPIVVISAYSDKRMLLDFISLHLVSYLIKPIDFEEFNNIILKCAKILDKNGLIEYQVSKNCKYSFSKKSLLINDAIVSLSPKEVLLLELLIENKNKLVTKEQIEDIVYDFETMTIPALNNLVLKLRKKIGDKNAIASVSSLGFMIVELS